MAYKRVSAYKAKLGYQPQKRLNFIRLIFIISAIVVLGRLFYIQVIKAAYLRNMRLRQIETTVKIDAPRGKIYDSTGTVIGESLYLYSVYANPSKITDKQTAATELALVLGMDKDYLYRILRKKKKFVWIKRHITKSRADAVRRLKLKYVDMLNEYKRYYPYNALAEHVIGYVDIDNSGLGGVELKYEKNLKGMPGWLITEQDAFGRSLLNQVKVKKNVKWGSNIYLTIDKDIQRIAEDELTFGAKLVGARAGSVIICEAKTGRILAMANYPGFNPNKANKYNSEIRKNRAITDVFEPGSTFKIVTLSGALDKKRVKPSDRFYCENGKMKVYNHYIHDDEKHQWLTVREIIEVSSNIGIIKIGKKLKKSELFDYIKRFGFGEKTGIDLPGESRGILRTVKRWSGLSPYTIPMGHEVGVTAIQLLMAMNVIASDGYLLKPYVVSKIINHGKLIYKAKPEIKRQVIKSSTAAVVNDILKGVVEKGTGQHAKISGYEFSGKTGTAQIYDRNKARYSAQKYMASFVGYFPSDNPLITMVVVINEPSRLYYGGSVSAPIFRRIAEQIIRKMNILPGNAKENPLVSVVEYKKQGIIGKLRLADSGDILVPDMNGYKLANAIAILTRAGLKYSIKDERNKDIKWPDADTGSFAVINQVPTPGDTAKRGESVFLRVKYVARIGKRKSVPNLKGLTLREARREALLNNFDISLFGSGKCYKQDPPVGTYVKPFSNIKAYFKEPEL